jgi:hypothetical protein
MLVLSTADGLTAWVFDGETLTADEHGPGTHMFTSGGAEDGKADRYLSSFEQADYPEGWRDLVRQPPADDLAALVVRAERDGLVFATVFGQLIEAQPGELHLEYSRQPWTSENWVARPIYSS